MSRITISSSPMTARMSAIETIKQNKFKIDFVMLLSILAIIEIAIAIVRSLVEPNAVMWLFASPEAGMSGNIDEVLAALLTLAIAIERLLETGFAWFEQMVRSTADLVSKTIQAPLDWVAQEYKNAYDATKKVFGSSKVEITDTTLKKMEMAEARLARAEERLAGWVNAPEYKAFKHSLCIWIGLLTGAIVSIVGDIGLFRKVGISVPRILDMLVTGILIGAGPGPMHSLIGIVQEAKDAIRNMSEISRGKAVQEALDVLKKEMEKR